MGTTDIVLIVGALLLIALLIFDLVRSHRRVSRSWREFDEAVSSLDATVERHKEVTQEVLDKLEERS